LHAGNLAAELFAQSSADHNDCRARLSRRDKLYVVDRALTGERRAGIRVERLRLNKARSRVVRQRRVNRIGNIEIRVHRDGCVTIGIHDLNAGTLIVRWRCGIEVSDNAVRDCFQ
jgi:hypothetical protein